MNENMSQNTIYGAGVVMVKDKEIYLCRRTEKIIFPKKWQFINGRINGAEQSMDTAIRLLNDQAMLRLDKRRLHFLQNVTVDETNEFYYVYVVNLKEGEVPMNTCNRWRENWRLFPINRATVLDLVPGIRPIIRTLERTRKATFEAPPPIQGPQQQQQQQQQQSQNISELVRQQQLSHGEQFHLDNMHAKMTRNLPLRLPF